MDRFSENVHSKEKDEAYLGFLENIFTKSAHRGGVVTLAYLCGYSSGNSNLGSLWSVQFICLKKLDSGFFGQKKKDGQRKIAHHF